MSKETIDLDLLQARGAHLVLLRTLMAEYLFIKGYLMPGLEELPVQGIKRLWSQALRFSTCKLLKLDIGDGFYVRLEQPFSHNQAQR